MITSIKLIFKNIFLVLAFVLLLNFIANNSISYSIPTSSNTQYEINNKFFNDTNSFIANGTIHFTIPINHNNTFLKSSITGVKDSHVYPNNYSNQSSDLQKSLRNALKSVFWGNWSIDIESGKIKNFKGDIKAAFDNASNFHTHELRDFRTNNTNIIINHNDTSVINGIINIGYNGDMIWKNVPTSLLIADRKILTIVFDDAVTEGHFSGQPIYGIIK
jgi:hypothetical protein